jgi:nitrite reductase/ring-hydroxylating ferredoxin subunit
MHVYNNISNGPDAVNTHPVSPDKSTTAVISVTIAVTVTIATLVAILGGIFAILKHCRHKHLKDRARVPMNSTGSGTEPQTSSESNADKDIVKIPLIETHIQPVLHV